MMNSRKHIATADGSVELRRDGPASGWELEREELVTALGACPRDRGGRRIYSSELSDRLIRYVARRRSAGAGATTVSRELGVCDSQIQRWSKRTRSRTSGRDSVGSRTLQGSVVSGLVSPGAGAAGSATASRLESAAGTDLERWREDKGGDVAKGTRGGFVELTVVSEHTEADDGRLPNEGRLAQGPLVVTSPSGWRVEGLSLSGLASLLNAGGK